MQEISWSAEQLSASEGGPHLTELDTNVETKETFPTHDTTRRISCKPNNVSGLSVLLHVFYVYHKPPIVFTVLSSSWTLTQDRNQNLVPRCDSNFGPLFA